MFVGWFLVVWRGSLYFRFLLCALCLRGLGLLVASSAVWDLLCGNVVAIASLLLLVRAY